MRIRRMLIHSGKHTPLYASYADHNNMLGIIMAACDIHIFEGSLCNLLSESEM